MKHQYAVEDEYQVTHSVRDFESDIRGGLLSCLDWYSCRGLDAALDRVARAQGAGDHRCVKGRPVDAAVTCIRCLATTLPDSP